MQYRNKILIIGGGANNFAKEGQMDAATYQIIEILKQKEYQVYYLDENPYSLSLEIEDITTFWKSMTVEHLKEIVINHGINYIYATSGGEHAMRLLAQLYISWREEWGEFPKVLGYSEKYLELLLNPTDMLEFLGNHKLPVIKGILINDVDDALDLIRELEFPVMIKAVNPMVETTRRLINKPDDFEENVLEVQKQSYSNEIILSEAVNGFKEFSVQVIRDSTGMNIKILISEDMEPVGVHTNDSLKVTQALTITDKAVQTMREYAFKTADLLNLAGPLHLQFAVNEDLNEIYITKVCPYIDTFSSLASLVTGYPLIEVSINAALNIPFTQIKLNDYNDKVAIMEPTLDHFAVVLPVFPFGELAAQGININRRLNTIQHSVGSAIGIGRTFIEALEKAIRSAHFNNRVFDPIFMRKISDDEMIQQLIHPEDNRVLLLVEAIRRGYTVDELSELTGIDEFYFYQLRRLYDLEKNIAYNRNDRNALLKAKKAGLSDGLIARFWNKSYLDVQKMCTQNNFECTYKAIEPTAGRYQNYIQSYYSTYEEENESYKLAEQKTAMVIGTGSFRLGDSGSAGYSIASVMLELKELGYQTILMNNTSTDVSLIPNLSDKQYIEPLEISDVMNAVAIEKPDVIVIPGNRLKLIDALEKFGMNLLILPKDKYLEDGPKKHEKEIAYNFFYDGKNSYPIALTEHKLGELNVIEDFDFSTQRLVTNRLLSPGLYQKRMIVDIDSTEIDFARLDTQMIHPTPFGQLAFLGKIFDLAFQRLTIKASLSKLTKQDYLAIQKHIYNHRYFPTLVSNKNDYHLHFSNWEEIDSAKFELGVTIKELD